MIRLTATDIRFMPARPDVRATGMRGWVHFTAGPWVFDSVSVRRGRNGRYHLTFPARTDSNGVEHAYVHPLNASVRAEIESSVLGELRKRGFIE